MNFACESQSLQYIDHFLAQMSKMSMMLIGNVLGIILTAEIIPDL